MAIRWNSLEMSKFLDVYAQYELLWNSRLEDYKNKSKRETAFGKLIVEIKKELGTFTVDQLRKKIKVIKTVYRKELTKVINSKKSGTCPDEMYTPKLAWFKKADSFLHETTVSRQSTSNLVLQPISNNELFENEVTENNPSSDLESSDVESSDVENIDVEHSYTKRNNKNNVSKQFLHGTSNRTPVTSKVRRCGGSKSKAKFHIDAVREAVGILKEIAASNNTAMIKDEFTQYGNHIAAQLRQLPIMNALRLQEGIQSLITKERLSCLTPTNNDYTRLVQETVTSENVSPTHSTSSPSSAFSDVLSFSEYIDNSLTYHDFLPPTQ